jgi:hypothetical protein
MAFTFSFPRPDDMLGAVQRASEKICSTSGEFIGDETAGTFVGQTLIGQVVGSYIVDQTRVSVTITAKPPVVLKSVVESKVRAFFA